MMVMPANNAGLTVGYLLGTYPGRIGWLLSPDSWKEPPDWMPYALDNGAYGAFLSGREFDFEKFYQHIHKTWGRGNQPRWIAVPDKVGNREETLRLWFLHSPRVAEYGKLAFVAQDGMTPDDIPPNASVVFIGGSTEWKWNNLKDWTSSFPRIHVGRVNTERLLWLAHEAGAESCDGTGWFRGDQKQLQGLMRYLKESSAGKTRRYELKKLHPQTHHQLALSGI